MKKTIAFMNAVIALFGVINVHAQAQGDTPTAVVYTYETQSTNKEVTVKMINDELDQTGVQVYFFDKNEKQLGKWERKNTSADEWSLSPLGNYFLCRPPQLS